MKRSISFTIITTFVTAIFVGTLLLMLPFSTTGSSISFEDALFTSTSAVTVTGLIVLDTNEDFTRFGKIVILVLIQLGGLGFMTFSTLAILLIGKSISISDKMLLENDFSSGNKKNIRDMIKKIILLTFGFELTGSIVLFFSFANLNLSERIFSSVFHSISAFCNAGFSIFTNNFENYITDPVINSTLSILIISGGIGFLVLNEIYLFISRKKSISKFSLHSKLVLITSFILIITGFVIILAEQFINSNNSLSVGEKIYTSLFHSVSARTAGFNTINLNYFSLGSVFILLILMFIGASPGSTGGGVKTSSAGMVIMYFRSKLKGMDKTSLFYRTIPKDNIEKAFIMIIISFLLISLSFLLILTFENELGFMDLLFETVSAFGTVGLSLGVTSKLALSSKFVIIITMFIGRIGPLTLLLAMSKKESKAVYNYPEENIMIG